MWIEYLPLTQFTMDVLTQVLQNFLQNALFRYTLVVLVVYLLQRLCQSTQSKPQAESQPKEKWSKSYLNDSRNRTLQHRLIRILDGDIAAAKRLLKQTRQLYPGQSDNWYLERVIHNLEFASTSISRELKQKLVNMLQGDIAAADRLLTLEYELHPGHSGSWYLEKVIHDLERDRH
jgi:hypothetical protein